MAEGEGGEQGRREGQGSGEGGNKVGQGRLAASAREEDDPG